MRSGSDIGLAAVNMDRRRLLTTGLAVAGLSTCLGGCLKAKSQSEDGRGGVNDEGSLAWAIAGKWRSPSDKRRDAFRHPIEMLRFFDIAPKSRVVDMWPGTGYISEILAPYLDKGKGEYVAALIEQNVKSDISVEAINTHFKTHFLERESTYGKIVTTAFGPRTGALVEAETADHVLFLLCLHDWMAAGIAEKAFSDAFAALKPGGVLGIEQHRADMGNIQDPAATNGYVQQPYVIQLAAEAGFVFSEASECNANPKDSKDYPFGVWTLPPQRLSAPRGEPANPGFDGTVYESIGESDRMTLKFKKPR